MSDRESARARRIAALFEAVVERSPDERAAWLDLACAAEPELRREVEELLAAYEEAVTGRLLADWRDRWPAPAAVGERIGPYVIRGLAGEGGMGAVYEAERADVGLRVAIKLARHGPLATPEQVRRFLLERRILARLQHPGITRLLDAGLTAAGLPYLVMEYVEGEPIDRYCDRHRLGIDERLRLFGRVCAVVAYAHDRGVVHRDLKPSNILVTAEGEPKLLDFGIAKLLEGGTAEAPGLTRTGELLATPEYAAPEQLARGEATPASDVYALGVVLYELLCGHRPHRLEGRSPAEAAAIVAASEPVLPADRAGRTEERVRADGAIERITPGAVAEARGTDVRRLRRELGGAPTAVAMKALSADPGRRYRTAHELSIDIDRCLRRLPVRPRVVPIVHRGRSLLRRRPAALPAAVAGAVVVAVASLDWLGRDGGSAEPALALATAELLDANGAIDCRGRPVAGERVSRGVVALRRTSADSIEVTVVLAEGRAGQVYSIELFEAGDGCTSDNLADTGARLTAGADGSGTATLRVGLPFASRTGGTLGDDHGSESAVVVLDSALSRGNGDKYVAAVPLPAAPPAVDERERRLVEGRLALRNGRHLEAERRFRSLLRDDPAAGRAWFELADLLFHYNPLRGRSLRESRSAFERALAGGEDADALLHLARVAAAEGRAEDVDALVARIERVGAPAAIERSARLLGAFAGRRHAEPEDIPLSGDDRDLVDVWTIPALTADVEAAAALARVLDRPGMPERARVHGELLAADAALARGRWREARERLQRAAESDPLVALELRALLAALPFVPADTSELLALRDSLSRWDPATAPPSVDPITDRQGVAQDSLIRPYVIGVVSAALGDADAAEAAARRIEAATSTGYQAAATLMAAGVRARLAWTLGRHDEALRRLEVGDSVGDVLVYSPHFGSRAHERFLRAELLIALDRPREALPWLATIAELSAADLVFLAPAHLRRGQIHERVGDADAAFRHYARVLELWRDCDPELRPLRRLAEEGARRTARPAPSSSPPTFPPSAASHGREGAPGAPATRAP